VTVRRRGARASSTSTSTARRGTSPGSDPATEIDLSVRLGSLELASPVVAASGTFGHGDEVARLGDVSQLGAVTAKSMMPEAWSGKPAPRLHMTAAGMLNAVGLQGRGIDAWIDDDLPGLRAAGARVIASLWGRTVDEYAQGAAMLARARDDLAAVELNVSCPNLHRRSEMFAHDPEATAEVVREVVAVDLGLPLFVKLSPNVTDITVIAQAAVEAGATGLTLVNTVMGLLVDAETRRPVLGGGGGGLSGPAIKPVALRAVHDVSCALPHIPIIGTGGVQTGLDAVEMMLAGASAVGVGTATFLDPRAAHRIVDEMREWCARHDVARVSELVGALTM
jgi:dihydroorotate dehydrogenase (NAD+) catalytic subunit